jgi:hypothetical protein
LDVYELSPALHEPPEERLVGGGRLAEHVSVDSEQIDGVRRRLDVDRFVESGAEGI